MTAPRRPQSPRAYDFVYAIDCAGYTVAISNGRVFLLPDDDQDGELTVASALALATTIEGAAQQARRMGRRAR